MHLPLFGSFYIPLAVMSFVYIKIFIATRRRLRLRSKTYAVSTVGAAPSETGAGLTTCPPRGSCVGRPAESPCWAEQRRGRRTKQNALMLVADTLLPPRVPSAVSIESISDAFDQLDEMLDRPGEALGAYLNFQQTSSIAS